ncbi:hypothetical protein LMG7974_01205 [Campylobacter majalis]|uniref:Uncharacterized protein n=2 Tax=Campylobacter majalis TaxID=2790656 RepID=A0ABM8Q7F1_9BACT|nr:hypothetical protein LMG7974_01205 [Campylobacter majalis]
MSEFEKLKNVNFKDFTGLNELNNFINDRQNFKEIKEISILASLLIQGVSGGDVAGVIVMIEALVAAPLTIGIVSD